MTLLRTLALTAALLQAGPLLTPSALAAGPDRIGEPALDKLFAEVASLDRVLDAAEGRLTKLKRDVAAPLGLPPDTPIARAAYTLKQQAGGEVRVMNVEGRPIVALGPSAPEPARDAATALNEGTQEVAVMARDLGRLPVRLDEIAARAETSGDGSDALARNLQLTREVRARATATAERALATLDEVREGIAAEAPPAAPAPTPVARPAPRPVAPIGEVLSRAWVEIKNERLEEAQQLLDQADMQLPRQTRPVSRGDLVELFQLRAHVNLALGDATAAAWAVTQSLVVHPTGEPLSKLGSDLARLHRAVARADIVRKVDVQAIGTGRAYLSGVELSRGATVQLGQGQHLLQIERADGWESAVVYVREGFVVEL